ncbi:MAG: TerC family protein [Syntrophobacteraceae bacterium]
MIELGSFGHLEFTWAFASALLSIVIIDLVLAGDNAVVIAMAVKNLHGRTRTLGIALGAGGAVLVRVVATFVVSQLLAIQFIKLAGGAVLIWIAVKLLVQGSEDENHKEAGNLWQAFWIIIVADMSMGIDNMLAVGAASHGNLFLLLFGLGLSIPFVVFMSNLLAKIMDRYPIILYIGAGILGKVGGEMMITDPFVNSLLHPNAIVKYGVMVFFTVLVIALGRFLVVTQRKKDAALQVEPQMAHNTLAD